MNWGYVGTVTVVGTLALLFIAGAITWQALHPRAGSSGEWPAAIVANLFCVVAAAGLYRKVYRDAHTKVTDDGVSQPGLFGGACTLPWREVDRIELFGAFGYHVIAGRKKIVVTPYAYKHPHAVIEALRVNFERSRGAT